MSARIIYFFLRRLREHLLPVTDLVAYCLMPNHYHLLVMVKPWEQNSQTSEVSEDLGGLGGGLGGLAPRDLSMAMMRLSVSYTKAINKRYQRVGGLFQGAFQSRHIDRNENLLNLSSYIHLNPLQAGLVKSPEEWEFSSYQDYLGMRQSMLVLPAVVLGQFQTPQAYADFCLEAPLDEQYNSLELGIDYER